MNRAQRRREQRRTRQRRRNAPGAGARGPDSSPRSSLERAFVAHRAGRLDEAEQVYRAVLQAHPDHPDAHHLLGLVAGQRSRYEDAERLFRRAISSRPGVAAYHTNLANVLRKQKRMDEALAACDRALRLDPGFTDADHVRGLVLRGQGRHAEARTAQERVLRRRPGHLDARSERGLCLMEEAELDQALLEFEALLERDPGRVDAHVNRGYVLARQGRFDRALEAYDRALRVRPDDARAHWNRAVALLTLGEYQEGWREYEWRWRTPEFTSPRRDFAQPSWDGGPLRGRTLLLHAEQGLGDSLQFIRYLPLMRGAAGPIVIECQTPLTRLFATLPGIEAVIPRGAALPPFDVHAPLLSLPHLLGTRLETIPARVPYLRPPPSAIPGRRIERSGEARTIGLAWAGRATHGDDRNRSIPLERFRPLLGVPGTRFFSLQVGARSRELDATPGFDRVRDLAPEIADLADTAAWIEELDLVISVDTAVAHLAGALGRPVWTLLPFVPDWRWLLDRDDSPWYPTMRLFRQGPRRDWAEVLARVRTQLERLARTHRTEGEMG